LKKVVSYNGLIIEEREPAYSEIPVNASTLKIITEGMIEVAFSAEGTAAEAFKGAEYSIAGKTGTAETSEANHSSNAIFVCFAPAEDPQVAVAVVIERGVWGSYAAFVARDILDEYFGASAITDHKTSPEPERPVYIK
ncbi:MAG: penicillin-binding transpeptidase domain-containing protein, partial [Eubacteriales bacterium]|nr:penicillin-binding transpeptidase domain-containing protein [Eubacteriales bacterium]